MFYNHLGWKSMAGSLLCSTNGNATFIRDTLLENYPSAHWFVLTTKGKSSWRYNNGEAFDKTDCGFYEVVWRGYKHPHGNCNKYSHVQQIIDVWVQFGGTHDEIRLNIIKGSLLNVRYIYSTHSCPQIF